MSVLIVSTPVGPIGSGVGGGVELTLRTIADGLVELGHHVEVIAPYGSTHVGRVLHHVAGRLEPSIQFIERSTPESQSTGDAVLVHMWNFARDRAARFDVVVNLAYDALPFRVGVSFPAPVVHLVSMASLTDAMDEVINGALESRASSIAMHSRAQAATFRDGSSATIVGSGIDVAAYDFRATAHTDGRLAFVGRLAAEKGLRDAVEVAAITGRPLHVWGYMQDPTLWHNVCTEFPDADVHYRGFVSTAELQSALGLCAGLLVTSKWVEAFGNVAIEALACGVPVLAYNRGGPAEIVVDGESGLLVEPDDVRALAEAVDRLETIDRAACRARISAQYSTTAFARRVEEWLAGSARGADFGGMPLSF